MRIAVLSTGRQDWGILRSTCVLLRGDPGFDLRLLLGGMHLSSRFGLTRRFVEEDGFRAFESLPWIPEGADPPVHEQAGAALRLLGEALDRIRPQALLLVGDRFETAAAALGATLCRVPVVHLHGGEETEGAIDNSLRHAITKLAHLHLVSHARHAARVVALGEDPARVHVVGAPGLDNLHRADLPGRAALAELLGIPLDPPVVVVALHPATLGSDPAREAAAVAEAMDLVPATYVVTLPNTDTGHGATRSALAAAARRPRRVAVEALGERAFWGLLKLADAILGNSSSALVEAPAVHLPAVNVGDRQKGRMRGANAIDAPAAPAAVAAALRQALAASFRRSLEQAPSPFGDGRSAERIVSILRGWTPPDPPVKRGPPVP